jgi:hypothetical protein
LLREARAAIAAKLRALPAAMCLYYGAS